MTLEQMVVASGLEIINGTRVPGSPGNGIYDAPPEEQAKMLRRIQENAEKQSLSVACQFRLCLIHAPGATGPTSESFLRNFIPKGVHIIRWRDPHRYNCIEVLVAHRSFRAVGPFQAIQEIMPEELQSLKEDGE